MSELELTVFGCASKEKQRLMTLLQKREILSDEGWSRIDCIELFNLSLHGFVKHHIADIFDVGKSLSL